MTTLVQLHQKKVEKEFQPRWVCDHHDLVHWGQPNPPEYCTPAVRNLSYIIILSIAFNFDTIVKATYTFHKSYMVGACFGACSGLMTCISLSRTKWGWWYYDGERYFLYQLPWRSEYAVHWKHGWKIVLYCISQCSIDILSYIYSTR